MKRQIGFFLSIIIIILFVIGCANNSDDVSQENVSITAVQVANFAQSGEWQVAYFYDTDQDETGNFSGYSFSFNENGTLVAVNGNTTVAGTWSITDNSGSSSDDDGSSSDNDNDFNIFFASPDEFEDLSDDWDIISISAVKIELIDVSGGNGGTDYLTLEKL
ncbi:MAG: hypothetical protein ACI840_000819 [Ulvibacter sp.]|jgi:hypothetical protein